MKIVIFGASGFIGSTLKKSFENEDIVTTIPSAKLYEPPQVIANMIKNHEVIINLAGSSIAGRWTKSIMKLINSSRIITTSNLVNSFQYLPEKPVMYINASGISIYRDGILADESCTEQADNYLAQVVVNWEKEIARALQFGINPTIIRLAVVLSRNNGAYPKLRMLVKSYLGGAVGSGSQGMSVVHIDDVVRAVHFIIENKLKGVINISIPQPVSNAEFTAHMAKILRRPVFFNVPVIILKLLLLEGHILLSDGQKAIPSVLIKAGFSFNYPDVYKCIAKLEE